MTTPRRRLRHLRSLPAIAAGSVVLVALLTAVPALTIDLGLPGEGDAVDYRVPLLRWMLRHRSYPLWDWSVVDDYPMLGELLMLPFYAARPALARLVPLGAYLLSLLVAAALFVAPRAPRRGGRRAVVAAAWAAVLYPLAFPSTLLMTDGLGTLGVLTALLGAIRGGAGLAAAGAALALASKYWTWPLLLPLLLAAALAHAGRPRARLLAALLLGGALGALPSALRNVVVNGNPFFPLLATWLGPAQLELNTAHAAYGRGTDLVALARLPWDLLVASNFEELYDYPLGVAFYLQLGAALLAVLASRRARGALRHVATSRRGRALTGFVLAHVLCWFYGAQQTRFLVPALVVVSLGLLALARRGLAPWALALVIVAGSYTFRVAHWGEWELARGTRSSVFAPAVERARACLRQLPPNAPLGLRQRDGFLGFVDVNFVFVPPPPYAVRPLAGPPLEPEFIYDPAHAQPLPGHVPWPAEAPCLWRRALPASAGSPRSRPGVAPARSP